MSKGNLLFLLNAHLPFVRHPDYEKFLEHNWLFEAISETYLPALRVFNKLVEDGIDFKVTVSISPTLATMLTDEFLQKRYVSHLKRLINLGEKEVKRNKSNPDLCKLSRHYLELNEKNFIDFTETYRENIISGFKALQKKGCLEIITSSATHSYLPMLENYPEAIDAQIQTAVISHSRIFGSEPGGIWIPECGYFEGLEKYLKSNNLKYSFLAAHGLLFSDPKPSYGVYAPVQCENGIGVFGRDIASAQAVWSSDDGYPGDISYRDYYHDIGYEVSDDYIGECLYGEDVRVSTGYKYYSRKGGEDDLRIYNPEEAERKLVEHAENFIYNRKKQIKKVSKLMDREPLVVCPYDAEIFGHWWFEGLKWFDTVIRKIHQEESDISLVTPSEYLKKYPENQVCQPAVSSWGNKGYSEVWLNGKNDWVYRHIHKAVERMSELVERYPDEAGLKKRVLNQAAREVLLSQASDWPFIMKNGTTVPYAVKRFREHIYNFNKIYDDLCRSTVDTEWVTNIEKKNSIFPDLDYRVFEKVLKD